MMLIVIFIRDDVNYKNYRSMMLIIIFIRVMLIIKILDILC